MTLKTPSQALKILPSDKLFPRGHNGPSPSQGVLAGMVGALQKPSQTQITLKFLFNGREGRCWSVGSVLKSTEKARNQTQRTLALIPTLILVLHLTRGSGGQEASRRH